MLNPYETLGVSPSASLDECKKAYRLLSRKYHPDNGGDERKFDEVQKAWNAISTGNVSVTFGIKRNSLRHASLFSFV